MYVAKRRLGSSGEDKGVDGREKRVDLALRDKMVRVDVVSLGLKC